MNEFVTLFLESHIHIFLSFSFIAPFFTKAHISTALKAPIDLKA